MRCTNYNVDLPAYYTVCPLCDKKATAEEPVLKDITPAEYPKLKIKPAKKNPLAVFLCVWLAIAAISFLLFAGGVLPFFGVMLAVCSTACIWAIIFRPVFVKQLYAGNFIMTDMLVCCAALFVLDYAADGIIDKSLQASVPATVILSLSALILLVLIKPKQAKRAVTYPLLLLPITITATLISIGGSKISLLLWGISTAACTLILLFLLLCKKQEAIEEIKAKFSIQ